MITIMKTSTFLNALDDAYAKGVSAGAMSEAFKDREDQNHRLHEMYKYGEQAGYIRAKDEIGEISEEEFTAIVDDMEDI